MFNFKDSHICSENINFLEKIIMDIENYPEFVPWCEQAKVADVTNERIIAKLVIVYKGMITPYKSTVTVDKSNEDRVIIRAISEQSPLKNLEANWFLEVIDKEKTKVDFEINFSFKSLFLHKILNKSFDKVCKQMMASFKSHVKKIKR